jgi:hypothetical protein
VDGGVSWSNPDLVSEDSVVWSHMLVTQSTIHRFWQEQDKFVVSNFHQISTDAGRTWQSPTKITTTDTLASLPAISVDWEGKLHFLQTRMDDFEYMDEWAWAEGRWRLQESKKIGSVEDTLASINGGVSSTGQLYAILGSESINADEVFQSDLKSVQRSLKLSGSAEPLISVINLPVFAASTAEATGLDLTQTPSSPLAGIQDKPALVNRNAVGMILLVLVIAVVLVLVVPRKKQ